MLTVFAKLTDRFPAKIPAIHAVHNNGATHKHVIAVYVQHVLYMCSVVYAMINAVCTYTCVFDM